MVLIFWYHYATNNCEINFDSKEQTVVGYFLDKLGLLSEINKRAFNLSLILYAEHDFNASTFASRICASMKSDFYSCVVSAIATLKGCLHGEANEQAIHLIDSIDAIENVSSIITKMLDAKKIIMGFGHRIYGKKGEPRTLLLKL